MPFDIRNWYWLVEGRKDRVFSSALGDYVSATDPTYLAWRAAAADHIATEIATESDLGEVLAAALVRPSRDGVLDAYKDRDARELMASAAFKLLFNHENRLRAIERSLALNGSPADLTAAQARNVVKALM